MANEYNIEIKSPEVRNLFMRYFDNEPEIKDLRSKKSECLSRGQYIEALNIEKKIEKKVIQHYSDFLSRLGREAERMDVNKSDMPQDMKDKLNVLYVTAFMACDIIESAVLEMDDLLKSIDGDWHVDLFDGIRNMYSEAQEKLRFFQQNSDFFQDISWGDNCDNMFDMMQNKARKLINQKKNS